MSPYCSPPARLRPFPPLNASGPTHGVILGPRDFLPGKLVVEARAKRVKVFAARRIDAVQGVAAGKIAATVMHDPRLMARTAAEGAGRSLKGGRAFPQPIPVAFDLVTIAKPAMFGNNGGKSQE